MAVMSFNALAGRWVLYCCQQESV